MIVFHTNHPPNQPPTCPPGTNTHTHTCALHAFRHKQPPGQESRDSAFSRFFVRSSVFATRGRGCCLSGVVRTWRKIRYSLNKSGNLPRQTNEIRSHLENGYRRRRGTGW